MPRVINITGIAKGANSEIDLGDYIEDKIAMLVKARKFEANIVPSSGSLAAMNTTLVMMDSGGVVIGVSPLTEIPAGKFTGLTVDNGGLLLASTSTVASGHAALRGSGRTSIILGDAIASNDILQITVLYLKDIGGLV